MPSTTFTDRNSQVRICACGDAFRVWNERINRGQGLFCSRECGYKYRKPNTRTFPPVEERFWSKVNRAGPDDCWLWTGCTDAGGYGCFNSGKSTHASRFSYELHYGVSPGDLDVLHICDNPPCVNPSHLFLGTACDNVCDAITKGRYAWLGEDCHFAKLTGAQVIEIRRRYESGSMSRAKLQKDFGVSQTTIQNIVTGGTWRHLP